MISASLLSFERCVNMTEPLFVEERRRIILDKLAQEGRVTVNHLSETMGVSAVTIRQDLRTLEDEGLLERTYGGAVTNSQPRNVSELSFHVRAATRRREKEAIASVASRYIENGMSVAIDCSSTAHSMVPYLKGFSKLTVFTNSLIIAQSLLDSPQIQVLMPGGRLRRDSISLVGRLDGLPDINFNVGFYGTRGIAQIGGVTDVDADEVIIKQAMVNRCAENIIVADTTKWGQMAPYTFARLDQVKRIITTHTAPNNIVDVITEAGVLVEKVNPAEI